MPSTDEASSTLQGAARTRVLLVGSRRLAVYPRGSTLIRALDARGYEVEHSFNSGLAGLFSAVRKLVCARYDVVIVHGRPLLPLAKLLTRKPIILDAFISLYDTHVKDRGRYSPGSFPARCLWWADRWGCWLADHVILDTDRHADYFCREFGLDREQFTRVWVGTDERLFYPRNEPKYARYTVWFHGTFIPLQGVEAIIRAAQLLQADDVVFKILGRGQTYPQMRELAAALAAENIEFLDPVPYDELPCFIARAHVGLGIFGRTDKTDRVIPNKAFEILACGTPLVTARSAATDEAGLVDRTHCMLVERDNPESLARAIAELRENETLRSSVAAAGHRFFKQEFSLPRIGQQASEVIRSVCRPTR